MFDTTQYDCFESQWFGIKLRTLYNIINMLLALHRLKWFTRNSVFKLHLLVISDLKFDLVDT